MNIATPHFFWLEKQIYAVIHGPFSQLTCTGVCESHGQNLSTLFLFLMLFICLLL